LKINPNQPRLIPISLITQDFQIQVKLEIPLSSKGVAAKLMGYV